MLAPALRDTHQGSAIAAGKLPGYKANPGGEMAPVLELGAIADRSHDGCRCLRAHTLDLRDPLAGLTRPEDSLDLLIKDPDPPVEIPEQIVEFGDCLARQCRQLILAIREEFREQSSGAGDAFGHGEAAVEQQPPDLADHGGAVIDHALAGTVQGLDILQQKAPVQASITIVQRSICATTARS